MPSIKDPIKRSPGFEKKDLATYKLDVMGRCDFSCTYCSSDWGNYLRINREKFAQAIQEQTGRAVKHTDDHRITFVWPDVIERLDDQLRSKPRGWGAGEVLVVSQLTDAFSPEPLRSGKTETALRMVLERTSFRIRILTKNSCVGLSTRWRDLFAAHRDRFVVGLSCGTTDDAWAKRVEIGTPSPSARIRATKELQAAGVPTFAMLCPVFPNMLEGDALEVLLDALNPKAVETVWFEPYNDRQNALAVRAGYDEGSWWWNWMTHVYVGGARAKWSAYAAELYERVRLMAKAQGWAHKLKYLLYEDDIQPEHAGVFAGLEGVLLQSKPGADGLSRNSAMAALQREAGASRMGKVDDA
ncbi:MAG: hypothetical protein ACTHU0_21675 [Kofleriaceae bacterium]